SVWSSDVCSSDLGGLALLTSRMLAGATFDPEEGTPAGTTVTPEGEAASPTGESITIYNRQHRMADAMSQAFTHATGIAVEQRTGEGAELAAQIAAEGSGSPADII